MTMTSRVYVDNIHMNNSSQTNEIMINTTHSNSCEVHQTHHMTHNVRIASNPPTHTHTHTHTHTRPPPPPLFVFDPKYVKSRLLPVHVRDLYPGNVIYLETSWLGSLSKVGENKPPEQDLVREPPLPSHTDSFSNHFNGAVLYKWTG